MLRILILSTNLNDIFQATEVYGGKIMIYEYEHDAYDKEIKAIPIGRSMHSMSDTDSLPTSAAGADSSRYKGLINAYQNRSLDAVVKDAARYEHLGKTDLALEVT